MATPISTPSAAGNSLIEGLPPELLEDILLEIVTDVPPPIKWDDHDRPTLRCHHASKADSSATSSLLAHRLVSRLFKNCSWRSLAKVLEETIFEIRSDESIANLVKISSLKELAPWVRYLTFSCFFNEPMRSQPLAWSILIENGSAEIARMLSCFLGLYILVGGPRAYYGRELSKAPTSHIGRRVLLRISSTTF